MNVERNNIGWDRHSIHHILHTIFTSDGDVYNCLSKIFFYISQTYHHMFIVIIIFLSWYCIHAGWRCVQLYSEENVYHQSEIPLVCVAYHHYHAINASLIGKSSKNNPFFPRTYLHHYISRRQANPVEKLKLGHSGLLGSTGQNLRRDKRKKSFFYS